MSKTSMAEKLPFALYAVATGTLMFIPSLSYAQSSAADAFAGKLLQNRYSLTVRSGRFSGTGARLLQLAIAQSRFVLVGEEHGLAETAEVWTGICNSAGPEGFHTMAIEEGPLAAAELEHWASRADGEAQLVAFEKQFPESINIYTTREEFGMLQQCARTVRGGFHLWGLNEEGLGAGGLILSRILDTRPEGEADKAMRQMLQMNHDAYARALESGSISDLFMISAKSEDLAKGSALLDKDGSPQAKALLASLIESHQINSLSPADYTNAKHRNLLMKRLFASDYSRAEQIENAPPKVLLKFGAYHIYRGLNPAHGCGLGNYVAELADGQGVQSLHICLMAVQGSFPIHPRVGQPQQLVAFNLRDDPESRYLKPMLANLLDSGWTLFDLRPLRQSFSELAQPDPALATLVFGVDILIVAPKATPSTEIR